MYLQMVFIERMTGLVCSIGSAFGGNQQSSGNFSKYKKHFLNLLNKNPFSNYILMYLPKNCNTKKIYISKFDKMFL